MLEKLPGRAPRLGPVPRRGRATRRRHRAGLAGVFGVFGVFEVFGADREVSSVGGSRRVRGGDGRWLYRRWSGPVEGGECEQP